MDIIMSIFNRTMSCLEGICNDIECNIDSGCCQTHKKMHDKTNQNDDLKENELKEKDLIKY
jgi:hypothetical protein